MRFKKSILPLFVVVAAAFAGCTVAYESAYRSSTSTTPARKSPSAAASAAQAAVEAGAPLIASLSLEASVPKTAPLVVAREAAAMAVLSRRVSRQSHPEALRLAFQAYYNYRAAHPEQVRKPYLYFVDYGLDSREPRGYVFDMDALEIVEGPFTVAHGRGSLGARDGVPTRFTNIQNSATSSLGLYLAQETYAFSGTSNGRRYRSVGLRLRGLSGSFNSAARSRGIVVHGAPYVTPAKAGRSEGCPAMEPDRAERLIPMIADGGVVLLFGPDERWLREDPWIHSARSRMAASGRAGTAG
jgi:hypothetical protein